MHQKAVAAWECTRLAEQVQDQQHKAISSSPLNIKGAKQDNWDPGHLDIWWHSSLWRQQYSTEIKTGVPNAPFLFLAYAQVLLLYFWALPTQGKVCHISLNADAGSRFLILDYLPVITSLFPSLKMPYRWLFLFFKRCPKYRVVVSNLLA